VNGFARRLPLLPVLLLAAVSLLSFLGATPHKDVIYEPTPMPAVRAMLELAKVGAHDVVYDLGSGDGRIVITAAKEFGARGVGVDIDPELIAKARENARQSGVENRVRFIQGNLFDADIGSATVVTLFLYEHVNLKLRPKLLAELKPGTRVVSYIWSMDDWEPVATRRLDNRTIYLWRVPERPQTSLQERSLRNR
jgi:SAM-dependent methyltransferase